MLQPINDPNGVPHQYNSNKEFVINLIKGIILGMFSNLNPVWVETLAIQLFNNVDNWKDFKSTIRDLMVSMRSFSATENAFYEHECKAEKDKQAKKDLERKNMIPGMRRAPEV